MTTLPLRSTWVYRLKGIPPAYTTDTLAETIQSALRNRDPSSSVEVHSLCQDCSRPNTQVATLTFSGCASEASRSLDLREFFREAFSKRQGYKGQISIDASFEDATTLATPDPAYTDDNVVDIVVVPDLASHPMNTFIVDHEVDYMWLRDDLCERCPNARVVVWGYESNVVNSHNFQSLEDIAGRFRECLATLSEMNDRNRTQSSRRPLILIGVGLGGLIIQNVITLLAESEREDNKDILYRICHLFMFGVPKDGMTIDHLKAFVRDRPNEGFIINLSSNHGAVLRNLQRQFNRVMTQRQFDDSTIWSFYETLETPLKVEPNGQVVFADQTTLLVTKISATHGRNHIESGPDYTIALNKNHHNIARFSPNDDNLQIVLSKISHAVSSCKTILQRRFNTQSSPAQSQVPIPMQLEFLGINSFAQIKNPLVKYEAAELELMSFGDLTPELVADYELIYLRMPQDENGRVTFQTFQSLLMPELPSAELLSIWHSFKPETSPLSKSFTMAAIFLANLSHAGQTFSTNTNLRNSEDWDATGQKWAFKRYEKLKRFDLWVGCLCGTGCGLRWNFVNDRGMCVSELKDEGRGERAGREIESEGGDGMSEQWNDKYNDCPVWQSSWQEYHTRSSAWRVTRQKWYDGMKRPKENNEDVVLNETEKE